MAKKLYTPKKDKAITKKEIKFIDRLEIFCIAAAAVVLIGWTGWSIKDALTVEPESEVYDINVNEDGTATTTSDGYEITTTVVGDEEEESEETATAADEKTESEGSENTDTDAVSEDQEEDNIAKDDEEPDEEE